MPSKLFSIRMDTATTAQLEARARMTREPKSRLARRLIEEGLRMEAHPGIVFRDGPVGRRPAVMGGPDVWEVARVIRDVAERGEPLIDTVVELTGLMPHQVQAALGYYTEHREDIDEWIQRVDDEAERAEAAWLREHELLAR